MFPYTELYEKLVLDISLMGVSENEFVSSDMTPNQVSCFHLRNSFYKKLAPAGANRQADERALEKFKQLNDSMSDGKFEYFAETEQDSLFWDYFKDNFRKAVTPGDVNFDLAFMRETFATGPGASLGHNNGNFYSKLFDGVLSTQHEYLIALYRAMISESETWAEAERLRFNKYGFKIVSGNRLFFVPKNAEISRTCCTEPGLELMFQKALGDFLEYCLDKSFNIKLDKQPDYNRNLARLGSIDGSFGTIDLSSASDSILWTLCKEIVPQNLLGFMRLFRSESTILPDGTEVPLKMVSTMGNGFTFPLETLIFSCALRSVYQLMNLNSSDPSRDFGVFGDDMVVRREAYDFLSRSLTKLGFTVNDEKSFNTGSFRESCGHDWHNGRFVRGVYIRSLETVSDVYSAINRLNKWSAVAGVRLTNTVGYLYRNLSRHELLLVPLSEQIDCGVQVPFTLSRPKVSLPSYWFSYRKLVREAKKIKVPLNVEESQKSRFGSFNEHGWAVTILGGYAKQNELSYMNPEDLIPKDESSYPRSYMTVRQLEGTARFKVRRCSIPYWDWVGATGVQTNYDTGRELWDNVIGTHCSFEDWRSSVTGNIG